MKWLSLGENCLPDAILERHGLKFASSPFSHGRSNIDYAIQADRSNFKGFLNKRNLVSAEFLGKPVLRSRLYTCEPDIFRRSVSNGFELTHHNPLTNSADLRSLKRKIARWIEVRSGKDDVAFLYHHRLVPGTRKLDRLVLKLDQLAATYSAHRRRRCFILCLVQEIVESDAERRFELREHAHQIWIAKIYCQDVWEGDGDRFFALRDDDLIGNALRAASSAFACQGLLAT